MKALIATVALLFLLVPGSAGAVTIQLSPEGCLSYSWWTGDIVWARDVGADKAKVRASLEQIQKEAQGGAFTLLLRDLDRLWALPRNAWFPEMRRVFQDCHRRLGLYEYHDT